MHLQARSWGRRKYHTARALGHSPRYVPGIPACVSAHVGVITGEADSPTYYPTGGVQLLQT